MYIMYAHTYTHKHTLTHTHTRIHTYAHSFKQHFTLFSQTLETLYCELKNDIFDERATMEELFYLIIELKNAVERKFMIKKLFWKVLYTNTSHWPR